MSTLVVCLAGAELRERAPVVGREAVEELVTTAGVEDPENSRVNCMLEGLRVARSLDEETIVAVLADSGGVGGEPALARQLDEVIATHDPDSAVVVIDDADDERLLPVFESRLPVDAVDRVVVRQARDIESTYYLLKQFLGDEQLRQGVLVPVGLALLALPGLLAVASPPVAVGTVAAVFGLLVLYKGLRIDTLLAEFSADTREALYDGRVSVVTYVVAGGLGLVGGFLGVVGASSLDGEVGGLLPLVQFLHDAVPWFTGAALVASAGPIVDSVLREDDTGVSYINLPFVALALGLAVRGFTAYTLQVSEVTGGIQVPAIVVGSREMEGFAVTAGTHLAVFLLASIVVSLVGVRVASRLNRSETDGPLDRPP